MTEAQIELGRKLIISTRQQIADDEAAAQNHIDRVAASSHIAGEVGDRVVIEGVVADKFSGPGGWDGSGWTITKIATAEGQVIYWGSLHAPGPDDFEVYLDKGDIVELKATIKEFSERDGEKQTVVQRPKIITYELTGETDA